MTTWPCSVGLIVLAAFLLSPVGADAQEAEPPTTVPRVDLERYAGLWYEIARIPNSFQDQCAWGTTAEYTLREDGRLDVMNRCAKADGEVDETRGVARVEDRESDARLGVSFLSILGWRPVWGDYWIIGLDEDYAWAVVGSPDRKYGWILARRRALDADTLEEIHAILRDQGYDPEDFEASPQVAPEGERS